MDFFSFQKSYAKILSKDLLYNIDTEGVRYFLFQAWGVVTVAHHEGQKRGRPIFSQFQGNICQEPLKLFYQKLYFIVL